MAIELIVDAVTFDRRTPSTMPSSRAVIVTVWATFQFVESNTSGAGMTRRGSSLDSVTVTLHSLDTLRPGRFNVTAEVREGPDGMTAGSVVLPDGSRIVLGVEPIVIGRLPECTVVLNDQNVSRRHAEIRRSGSDVVVADLKSTNGTKVNGAPVTERVLEDGDDVTVGTTTLRFETS